MCGIAGKLTWDPRGAIDPDLLGAMTDAVRHRGPDADGFYFGDGVGPRASAPQHHRPRDRRPAARERRPHRVDDLQRRDLQLRRGAPGARGARTPLPDGLRHRGARARVRAVGRRTSSIGCAGCSPSRCGTRGSAGWSSRAIASGVKPLHYAVLDDGLVFGSEIKSLLVDPGRAARLEPRGARRVPGAALRSGAADHLPRRSTSCRRATCSWRSAVRCA